ncbi:hypothetical protein [Halostagnicola bangensis]
MAGEHVLRRRTILAGVGIATASLPTVQAYDHDDRRHPYTREAEGVAVTFHDCSRITVAVDDDYPEPEEIIVEISYHDGPTSAPATEDFDDDDPDYPREFDVNCPSVLGEIGAINDTSAVVRGVRIYRDGKRLV